MLTKLEEDLFEGVKSGKFFSLTQAAFIVSGVDSSQMLGVYMRKFYSIVAHLRGDVKGYDEVKARTIFDWLWKTKPRRYQLGGNFKLTQVVDAQLGETEKVGNCLGLTLLYNSLAQEFGLSMKATYLDNFLGYPHVFSILHAETV